MNRHFVDNPELSRRNSTTGNEPNFLFVDASNSDEIINDANRHLLQEDR